MVLCLLSSARHDLTGTYLNLTNFPGIKPINHVSKNICRKNVPINCKPIHD